MIYESKDNEFKWKNIESSFLIDICKRNQEVFAAAKELVLGYLSIMEQELEEVLPGAPFYVSFNIPGDRYICWQVSLEDVDYLIWRSGKSRGEWAHMGTDQREQSLGVDCISFVEWDYVVWWRKLPRTFAFYKEHGKDLDKYGLGLGSTSDTVFLGRDVHDI